MQSYMHMRCQARQLDSYSTARHCSTARQLDRTRQTSTDLDTPAHAVSLDLPRRDRQLLDSYSTATRQLLDRLDRQGLDRTSTAASTAARRSLDSSTARQPALNPRPPGRSSNERPRPPRCRASACSGPAHDARARSPSRTSGARVSLSV